jgi:5-methylcytosine-specific restriction protein A
MNLLNAQFREFAGTYPRLTQRPFKHTKETKILTNEIPELLYGQLGLSEQDYKIYGSVGNGNWVEVAWLGLLDRRITESTTRGYYVVFLFDSKLENIYLCLSLGWTQFEKEFGVNEGRQKIRAYSDHYAKLLNQSGDFKPGRIDLKAKNTLGKGYESGTVLSKKYNILKLDSADLLEDINKALTIY